MTSPQTNLRTSRLAVIPYMDTATSLPRVAELRQSVNTLVTIAGVLKDRRFKQGKLDGYGVYTCVQPLCVRPS